jgi:uncharacterized protein (DUF488 family)
MSGRNLRDIGYEGKTIEEVVASLHTWGVETLVDVRLNAISRKKGFSKTALRMALESNGLSYLHLPELGNAKDNRAGFYMPGGPAATTAHENYLRALDRPAALVAMDEIERLAGSGGAALLCFEAHRSICHRDLVLQRMLERSLQFA